jgi:hypothetical protein
MAIYFQETVANPGVLAGELLPPFALMIWRQPREEAVQMVRRGWFDLSLEEWNVKCTDDGRQEQSRKKQKKQQQSPATDSWTVDFMTRHQR